MDLSFPETVHAVPTVCLVTEDKPVTEGMDMKIKRMAAGMGASLMLIAVAAVGPVSAAPILREAALSGDDFQEGDPNATGRAALDVMPARGKICFRITYRRMVEPTYGSIHSGSMEFGGPLEVTLFNGDRGGRSSPIEGCVRNLDPETLREIKEHPRRFYVDLNQHVYANSAIRGLLQRSG